MVKWQHTGLETRTWEVQILLEPNQSSMYYELLLTDMNAYVHKASIINTPVKKNLLEIFFSSIRYWFELQPFQWKILVSVLNLLTLQIVVVPFGIWTCDPKIRDKLFAVFVFQAMEIFPWKLFMHPLKTPRNISMYQGKQMKNSHASNGKNYMEK